MLFVIQLQSDNFNRDRVTHSTYDISWRWSTPSLDTTWNHPVGIPRAWPQSHLGKATCFSILFSSTIPSKRFTHITMKNSGLLVELLKWKWVSMNLRCRIWQSNRFQLNRSPSVVFNYSLLTITCELFRLIVEFITWTK